MNVLENNWTKTVSHPLPGHGHRLAPAVTVVPLNKMMICCCPQITRLTAAARIVAQIPEYQIQLSVS